MLKFDRLSEGRDDEVVKEAMLDIGGGRNSRLASRWGREVAQPESLILETSRSSR
jgi:hypothetical protein